MVGTFAFVVDLRRGEMALLRLVGATSRQMRHMIVGEAALIGTVAASAGAVAGACGGHLVGHYAVTSGNAPGWFTVGFTWWPVLAGFAVGLLSALLGSVVSAWRPGRVAPIEALREAAVDQRVMTPLRWLLGIASLVAALYFAVDNLVSAPFELTNPRKTVEVPLLFVAAFALLAPVLLAPLARWLTWPLTRLGPGSMIVRANIGTAARRTAAVAGSAVVAVGVAAAFFVQQNNASSALSYQATQTNRADYVVEPAGGDSLPAGTIAVLRKVPGAQVVPVEDIVLYVGTRKGEFIDSFNAQAVSAGALPGVEDPAVRSGSVRGFGPGSLVVDEKGARADGLRVGMRLAVWGPDGTRRNVTLTAIVATGLAGDLVYVSTDVMHTASPARVGRQGPARRQRHSGRQGAAGGSPRPAGDGHHPHPGGERDAGRVAQGEPQHHDPGPRDRAGLLADRRRQHDGDGQRRATQGTGRAEPDRGDPAADARVCRRRVADRGRPGRDRRRCVGDLRRHQRARGHDHVYADHARARLDRHTVTRMIDRGALACLSAHLHIRPVMAGRWSCRELWQP